MKYEDSDLDLYVNHSQCYEVKAFPTPGWVRTTFDRGGSQSESFEANAAHGDWLMHFIVFTLPPGRTPTPRLQGVEDPADHLEVLTS